MRSYCFNTQSPKMACWRLTSEYCPRRWVVEVWSGIAQSASGKGCRFLSSEAPALVNILIFAQKEQTKNIEGLLVYCLLSPRSPGTPQALKWRYCGIAYGKIRVEAGFVQRLQPKNPLEGSPLRNPCSKGEGVWWPDVSSCSTVLA